jgi:hypothetical protein
MTPLAHAAHWAEAVMFLGPTLVFIVWLVFNTRRERQRLDAKRDRTDA